MHPAYLIVVAIAVWSSSPTAALDLHAYWDHRCGTCHGHAGAFARQFLTVKDGELKGRHHVDNLKSFLPNHYLPADMVGPITEMLAAQAIAEPRFRTECGNCHDSAAALVRKNLLLRDNSLTTRDSGQPVTEFLGGHVRLAPEDLRMFVDVLTRIAHETQEE